jgi:hypothetical protein
MGIAGRVENRPKIANLRTGQPIHRLGMAKKMGLRTFRSSIPAGLYDAYQNGNNQTPDCEVYPKWQQPLNARRRRSIRVDYGLIAETFP